MILGIMAHCVRPGMSRYQVPLYPISKSRYNTGLVPVWNGTTPCLKQNKSCIEMGVTQVSTRTFLFRSRSALHKDTEYTEPRRGWKWKIEINPCYLGPLGPLKKCPKWIVVPSLSILLASAHDCVPVFFYVTLKKMAQILQNLLETT